MLKTIADASPQLVTFILALRLSLSRPQLQHVTQVGAMEKRARLMGLDEVKPEEVGPKEVTLRILPPKGYPDIRPPLPDKYRRQEEDAARLAAGEDVLADNA